MKYLKNSQNEVFAFAGDGSQDEYIPEGLMPISEAVALSIVNPPPTASQLRATKEAALRAEGSLRLAALAAPYLPAERETWATQQGEARAWSLDPAAPTPMLSAMAFVRGISLAALVAKVLGNVALFEAASGAILGQQQALLDALAAVDPTAPDAVDQIAAIAWEV